MYGFNKLQMAVFMATVVLLFHQNPKFCFTLNSEGLALLRFRDRVVRDPFGALSNWNENDGVIDPCSWFGVECSDGNVIILNLKDLCLDGTMAPELGNLIHVKFIILRNNSFSGNIPSEIGEMRELEVLDLGYNNFSGPFPSDIGNSPSLTTLLLDNNKFLGSISPELFQLKTLSEFQIDENQLTKAVSGVSSNSLSRTWNTVQPGEIAYRRQVVEVENHLRTRNIDGRKGFDLSPSPSVSSSPPSSSPSQPPFSPLPSQVQFSVPSPASPTNIFLIPSPSSVEAPNAASPAPAIPPTVSAPPHFHGAPMPFPVLTPIQSGEKHFKSKLIISAGVIGGFLLILISAVVMFFIRRSKVVTVKPWVSGLSGQLQKALVTGVPKLKRSELEAACEDFSNIIGSLSDGIVYKGTLSSGVEIAVTSTAVTSTKDWLKTSEARFRKKIKTLSKLSHKNFVNLIGYCEEEEPFTRMMVFEYAPNGTLFEHLHIKEAEHLDWGMRLRIAMGMAYCLEHTHQLTPPIAHENLQSSSVYLTEDYAAKISDFSFSNDLTAAKIGSSNMELFQIPSEHPGNNVYNFGVILFELITGRIPYSVNDGPVSDWASDYLSGKQPLIELVDPTLKSFEYDKLGKLLEVIKSCVHPDLNQRSTLKEIAIKLKEITTMGPDGATPKLSPLWWAELEIMSTEAS